MKLKNFILLVFLSLSAISNRPVWGLHESIDVGDHLPISNAFYSALTFDSTAKEDNEYAGIAKMYDSLMESGYYDHEKIAEQLINSFSRSKNAKKIIELGCGTGLLIKTLIEKDKEKNYQFSGIDISKSMLKISKERLKGTGVNLYHQDISKMDIHDTFDVAFCQGGFPGGIELDGQRYRLCSFVKEYKKLRKSLCLIHKHLNDNGLLLINVQDKHKNLSIKLKNNITYSQKVYIKGDFMEKEYLFVKQNGYPLAYQKSKFLLIYPLSNINVLLKLAGFTFLGSDSNNMFMIYKKENKDQLISML